MTAPADWTPLIIAVGGAVAAIITSIVTLITAMRTGQKTDQIHGLVNSKMDEAQKEIKRLGGVVEKFAMSGKPITEQEAGLILNKVIEVANGKVPHDPPIPNPVLPDVAKKDNSPLEVKIVELPVSPLSVAKKNGDKLPPPSASP